MPKHIRVKISKCLLLNIIDETSVKSIEKRQRNIPKEKYENIFKGALYNRNTVYVKNKTKKYLNKVGILNCII